MACNRYSLAMYAVFLAAGVQFHNEHGIVRAHQLCYLHLRFNFIVSLLSRTVSLIHDPAHMLHFLHLQAYWICRVSALTSN